MIQGQADTETDDAQIQKRTSEGVGFALEKMTITPEAQQAVLDKVQEAGHKPEELEKLTPEELHILDKIATRNISITKTAQSIDTLANDVINGLSANLKRGDLGLVKKDQQLAVNGADMVTQEAMSFNRQIKQEA